MLKVSPSKAIAGYAPCSECGTPAAVHFPDGGKRANTPYLSCGGCNKTIQSSGTKAHIQSHYVATLEEYAYKYDVDVSDELEQITANKWTENPAQYEVKMNGIVEPEPILKGEPVQETVVIDNDTQEVVQDKTPKPETSHSSALLWVGVLVVISLFGVFVVRKLKAKSKDESEDKSDE